MAMYRDVERGLGVLDPVIHVFTGGFQLPVLTVLSRMTQYAEYTGAGVSPLPILVLAAAAIYGFWCIGTGESAGLSPARESKSAGASNSPSSQTFGNRLFLWDHKPLESSNRRYFEGLKL